MGGIGKTSLAAAYVAQEYDNYQHIAWISNNSADIADDFVQNRDLLQSLDLTSLTGDREVIFHAMLHKLRSIDERPKLFVIDNADAEIERRLPQLPSQPNWHVLITSREEIAGTHSMPLGFLQAEDAVRLFKKHCTRISSDNEITAIVETVDYHTLTIEILARTAQLQRTNLNDLLNVIRNDARANVKTAHSNQAKIERVRSYLETIFDFSGLNDNEQWLLKQFVALPPEFQSYELLVELIEPEQSDRAEIFSELLDNLAGKGWLLSDPKNDSYKMHRVVQEVFGAKMNIQASDIKPLIVKVGKLLQVDQSLDNPVDKFVWIPYGEAVTALVGQFEGHRMQFLLHNLGVVLKSKGEYHRARQLLERARTSFEEQYGVDNIQTTTCCSNLGLVLKDLGKYQEAKVLFEHALETDKEVLGEEHQIVGIRYTNLGLVLKDFGDYKGARVLLERALAINKEKFGENHHLTASSYSNLGLTLQFLGDYDEAKVLLERAVVSNVKNFGLRHPTTTSSYSNLALVLQELGDYEKAMLLLEFVLTQDSKTFGVNHPITAIRYSNLGELLRNVGDLDRARNLLEIALASTENTLGAEHSTMAIRYTNLGLVLQDLGDYSKAKEFLELAVSINEQLNGKEHPDTATAYSNLGWLLQELGDINGAKENIEQAVKLSKMSLGKDHPKTAAKFLGLARVLLDFGELKRSLTLASQALKVFENTLPKEHPNLKYAKEGVEHLESLLNAQTQE